MKTVVMKFGGEAVKNPQSFHHIADLIIEEAKSTRQIVVVVSAMRGMTDQLIGLAKMVHSAPPRREYDMLVSVGERISISLLAMALAVKNKEAVSFTGSQSGMITDENHSEAKIIDVRPHRLIPHLEKGKCVIVAGFQGVSEKGQITTLGRGGSDASAVALAIALQAERVKFFKDVSHIFDADPKIKPFAKPHSFLGYDQALEIVSGSGGKVLLPRCIELAKEHGIALYVNSFKKRGSGTLIYEHKKLPKAPIYENYDKKYTSVPT